MCVTLELPTKYFKLEVYCVVEDSVLRNLWNGVQAGESKSGTVTIRVTQIFGSRICHKTPIIE